MMHLNGTYVQGGGIMLTIASASYLIYHQKRSSWWPWGEEEHNLCYAGLINHNNNCYMNAILQSMSSCPALIQSLQNESSSPFILENNLFVKTLLKILLQLARKSTTVYYDPAFVMTDLESRGWSISSEEHDAHEFFHAVVTTMDDEHKDACLRLMDSSLSNALTTSNDIQPSSGIAFKPGVDCIDMHSIKNFLKLKHGFHGRVGMKLVCQKCGHQNAIRYDAFDSLSLPFFGLLSSGRVSITACIESYFMPEKVNDVNCESCSKIRLKQQEVGDAAMTTKVASPVIKHENLDLHNISLFDMTLSHKSTPTGGCESSLPKSPSLPTTTITTVKPAPVKRCFKKTLFLVKYPETLCIHLQRLTWLNGFPQKMSNHVQFSEVLYNTTFEQDWFCSRDTACKKKSDFIDLGSNDISDYVLQKGRYPPYLGINQQGSLDRFWAGMSRCQDYFNNRSLMQLKESKQAVPLYKLCAVIVHLGGWNSAGHFVTYRRVSDDAYSWVNISDTYVKPCSLEEVFSVPAYMLFYERIADHR